MNCTTSQ